MSKLNIENTGPSGHSNFMSAEVCKYALAIKDTTDRLQFGQSTEKQKFIFKLKPTDHVKVPYGSFGFNNKTFLRGFIQHLVHVNELGPGIHFIVASAVISFTKVLNNVFVYPNC